jgi:hypothetical protein
VSSFHHINAPHQDRHRNEVTVRRQYLGIRLRISI